MALDKKELEQIEHIINDNSDELAMAVARAFERLGDKLTAMESRLSMQMEKYEGSFGVAQRDLAEKFAALGKEIAGQISEVN